ncbi:MAG: 50S ribosomal protein L30 [Owenweeksia sp.]|nr:50S ribosomal protein L30 [Owenweeksia sp.]
MAKIKVKQVRSKINRPASQKKTLEALGLRKMNQVVEHNDTPQILGMVKKCSALGSSRKSLISIDKKLE